MVMKHGVYRLDLMAQFFSANGNNGFYVTNYNGSTFNNIAHTYTGGIAYNVEIGLNGTIFFANGGQGLQVYYYSEYLGIETTLYNIPNDYILEQNFPNPFNHSTSFNYTIPIESNVKIIIFDIFGNRIDTIIDMRKPAGTHQAIWRGINTKGEVVASGTYFYYLNSGDFTSVKKMLLIK